MSAAQVTARQESDGGDVEVLSVLDALLVSGLKVKSALTVLKRLREKPDEVFVTLQELRYGLMLGWIRHWMSKLKS